MTEETDFIEQLQNQHTIKVTEKNVDLNSTDSFPSLPKSLPKVVNSWKPPKSAVRTTTERLEIPLNMQVRQQLGKQTSASQVCKDLMQKHKTSIEFSTNKNTQSLTFIITGLPENVKIARKQLLNILAVKITETVTIPVMVRPFLLGKGGAALKDLTSRTLTNIQIPKFDKNNETDEDIQISITGHFEAIQDAKKEIDELVAQRTSNHYQRVTIERSFHPFLAGANKSNVGQLQEEFGIKIHIPPYDAESTDKKADEILLVGERAEVLKCEAKLLSLYQDFKQTTKTLNIAIPKKQHRFIIGPKGSGLQEIMQKSGCVVEVPSINNPVEDVLVRGPQSSLSTALALVLERANSVSFGEFELKAILPSTVDATLFVKYLLQKERSFIKNLETEHSATIQFQLSTLLVEVQAKTLSDLNSIKDKLGKFIKEASQSQYLAVCAVPSDLHRFIVGKGGQNIQKLKGKDEWSGRLVDIMVPSEDEEINEIVIVVKKNSPTATADKEALEFANQIKKYVVDEANASADLTTTVLQIDQKYHGRLIGSGGAALKEMLTPYGNSVIVRFGSVEKNTANSINIKGPQNDVVKVAARINELVAEWKHIEVMASFTEALKVPSGYAKQLVGTGGTGGKDINWISKTVKEQFASKKFKLGPNEKSFEKDLTGTGGLYLSFDVASSDNEETVTIKGPKSFVVAAKSILQEKLVVLLDTDEVKFNIFDLISKPAQAILGDNEEMKKQMIKFLIGKEGKALKKILEACNVQAHFSKEDEEEENGLGFVHIHGNKAGVLQAKNSFIETVQDKILNSYSVKIVLPKASMSVIVGRGGSNMAKLSDANKVRIDFGLELDDDMIECTIEGNQAGCEKVKNILESIGTDIANTTTLDLHVPTFLHKLIIGPAGSVIREFIENLGGSEKVKINFPKPNDGNDPNIIVVTANADLFGDIEEKFFALLTKVVNKGYEKSKFVKLLDLNHPTKQTVTIPKSDANVAFGRSKDGLYDLMRKFAVSIWPSESSDSVTYTIVGDDEKEVLACKTNIASKIRITQTVPVPASILESIKVNPLVLQGLQDVVKKINSGSSSINLSAGAIKGEKDGHILVKGDKGKVAELVKSLTSQLKQLELFKFVSQLAIPEEFGAHIIGRKGVTINRIRDESGAHLDLDQHVNKNTRTRNLTIRAANETSLEIALKSVNDILESQRALQDAQKAPQTAARVDDDVVIGKSGIPKNVPNGYHGKSKQGNKISSMVTVNETATSNVKVEVPVKQEWESVPVRSKKLADALIVEQHSQVNGVVGSNAVHSEKPKKRNEVPQVNGHVVTPIVPLPKAPEYIQPEVEVDEWQTVNPGKKSVKPTTVEQNPASSAFQGIPVTVSSLSLISTEETASKKKKKKKKTASAAVSSE
ncbi:hypothetical protein HDV06_005316 [Boothiomyces sp. JEL0866]|nr:hypothetical protein HDV06_005316 [Boothiomyces sp. JEL0866]